MNEKSNTQELKKAIAKSKTAAEALLKFIHKAKLLDDEQITCGAIDSYDQKLSAFEDCLKTMETERLVNGKLFSEIVQPLTRFDDLSLIALRAGNAVEQNDLKSFEYAILKTMDKLNELKT